jgi:hypothetical protein
MTKDSRVLPLVNFTPGTHYDINVKLSKHITKLGAVEEIVVVSCPGLSLIFAGSMLLLRLRSLLAPPPVSQLNSRLRLSLVRTCVGDVDKVR